MNGKAGAGNKERNGDHKAHYERKKTAEFYEHGSLFAF
jgi:hypothetical protein